MNAIITFCIFLLGACEDEDNKIQLYCGEMTNLYFSSTKGRYILIHFHTDYSVTHTGWELEYYTLGNTLLCMITDNIMIGYK